jgi:hypothetical protein
MSTLTAEVRAQAVVISDDSLTVDLVDGRTISVPLPLTGKPSGESQGSFKRWLEGQAATGVEWSGR